MSGSNDDLRGRQFMDARDLAPLFAKFTHRLSQTFFTRGHPATLHLDCDG
jgi:hypothetical protein